jgi:uncharacterized protein DUF6538
MMLPQCSHITRKRGVYYYRRRLPGATKSEIALSLRTRMFREAQWLAAQLDQEFRGIIASLRQNKDTADVQRIAREYLKSKLDHDMEQREAASRQAVYATYAEVGSSFADDLAWVETELQTARTELRERLYDHQRPLIDEVMEAHSLPPQVRNALAHAVFRANVEFWETVRQRTLGDFSQPRAIEHDQPVQSNGPKAPSPSDPLLSEVLPGFLDFMSKQEGWRGQTLKQNTATYNMFIECCGDQPVTAYERKDLAAFYDTLRGLACTRFG